MKNELSHRRTPKINQCKDSRQVQKQNRMLQIAENCQQAKSGFDSGNRAVLARLSLSGEKSLSFDDQRTIKNMEIVMTQNKHANTIFQKQRKRDAEIIQAISTGATTLKEISNDTGIDWNTLRRDLFRLIRFREVVCEKRRNHNHKYQYFFSLPDEPKFNRPK